MINFLLQKQRRLRQNVTAFEAYVAEPFTSSLKLPANARLALRATSSASLGTLAATIQGSSVRQIRSPSMQAGEYIRFYAEKDSNVVLQTNFELYLDTGLGRFIKIGEP